MIEGSDQSPWVLRDCPRCGYSLIGLANASQCPECSQHYDATNTIAVAGIDLNRYRRSVSNPAWVFLILAGVSLYLGPTTIDGSLASAGALIAVFFGVRNWRQHRTARATVTIEGGVAWLCPEQGRATRFRLDRSGMVGVGPARFPEAFQTMKLLDPSKRQWRLRAGRIDLTFAASEEQVARLKEEVIKVANLSSPPRRPGR